MKCPAEYKSVYWWGSWLTAVALFIAGCIYKGTEHEPFLATGCLIFAASTLVIGAIIDNKKS